MPELIMNSPPSCNKYKAETRPTPSSEIATEAVTDTFSAKSLSDLNPLEDSLYRSELEWGCCSALDVGEESPQAPRSTRRDSPSSRSRTLPIARIGRGHVPRTYVARVGNRCGTAGTGT